MGHDGILDIGDDPTAVAAGTTTALAPGGTDADVPVGQIEFDPDPIVYNNILVSNTSGNLRVC